MMILKNGIGDWGLEKDFNPVNFDPEQWAKAGKDAGMRYLVFTTKHHDGFNMFDTKETDFEISAGPFKNNPKADVAKYVFDAFRKNNFMIGAYFSKPTSNITLLPGLAVETSEILITHDESRETAGHSKIMQRRLV